MATVCLAIVCNGCGRIRPVALDGRIVLCRESETWRAIALSGNVVHFCPDCADGPQATETAKRAYARLN